jgi:hypothetical protein
MADIHEGGCHCGAVRYRVLSTPMLTGVCHCTSCQRRTGSAFGISAYFAERDVEIMRGVLKTYEYRSDESHRWAKTEFCPTCGTTVTWTAEVLPGARGIAGGPSTIRTGSSWRNTGGRAQLSIGSSFLPMSSFSRRAPSNRFG